MHDISQFTRQAHEMEVDSLNTKWLYEDEIYVSGNWGKNATTVKIVYNNNIYWLQLDYHPWQWLFYMYTNMGKK
jgi:hypothetical protein